MIPVCPNCKYRVIPLAGTNRCPQCGSGTVEPSTLGERLRDLEAEGVIADPKANPGDAYQAAKVHTLAIGDTFMTSNSFVVLKGLNKNVDKKALGLAEEDIAVSALLHVEDLNKKSYEIEPVFIIRNLVVYTKDALVDELGLKFEFQKINTDNGTFDIALSEKKSNRQDFIIMKAIIFPGINLLWTGCILLIIGSLLAVRHRIQSLRRSRS